MQKLESHKDLSAWQKGLQLAGKVYALTRQLPTEEHDALGSQLRRCASAVPCHIADGFARRNRAEFVQQLRTARGALLELETQLLIAIELQYLSTDSMPPDIAEINRLLSRLIGQLASSHRQAHADACIPFDVDARRSARSQQAQTRVNSP